MDFFIISKNDLNGEYMVHSKCEQISNCYHFKSKKEAEKFKLLANKIANKDYEKYKDKLSLTWK